MRTPKRKPKRKPRRVVMQSEELWAAINAADYGTAPGRALYLLACACQELELRVAHLERQGPPDPLVPE